MIADSDYEVGELVAAPRVGFLAGVLAGGLMLVVLGAASRPGGARLWLEQVGATCLPDAAETSRALLGAGLTVHFGIAGLFGALYAACQQRTTPGGLLTVGCFYGFVLWLACDLLLVRWLHVGPSLLQTWSVTFGVVGFGAALAAWAIGHQHLSARGRSNARPID